MENIDELMRVKFESDHPADRFEFREEYWEQAQALLEAEEARRRKRRRWLLWWSFGIVSLLGFGIYFGMELQRAQIINSQSQSNQTIDNQVINSENKLESSTTTSIVNDNSTLIPTTNATVNDGIKSDPTAQSTTTVSTDPKGLNGSGSRSSKSETTANASGKKSLSQRKVSNKGGALATQSQQSASLLDNSDGKVSGNSGGSTTNKANPENLNPLNAGDHLLKSETKALARGNSVAIENPNQLNIGSQSESGNKTQESAVNQTNIAVPTQNSIESGLATPEICILLVGLEPLSIIPGLVNYEKQPFIIRHDDLPQIIKPVKATKPFSHSLYLAGTYHTPADSANWGGVAGYGFGWKFKRAFSLNTGLSLRYIQGSWALDSTNLSDLGSAVTDYSFGFNSTKTTSSPQGLLFLEIPLGLKLQASKVGITAGITYTRLLKSLGTQTTTTDGSFLDPQVNQQRFVSTTKSVYKNNTLGAYLGLEWNITSRLSIFSTASRRPTTPTKSQLPVSGSNPDLLKSPGANYWFDLGIKFKIRS